MTESETAEARELEYVKAMIDWARDDTRQVHLRVTAALAIAALFITQLPFDDLAALGGWFDVLLIGGIVCLVLGAVSHFVYLSRVHRSRRGLASCLRTADGDGAAAEWEKVWKRWNWSFIAGDALTIVGVGALGAVLIKLLTG